MIDIDEVKRRLKTRYNIEEDELIALGHNSEEKIRAYYQTVAMQSANLETEDDDEVKTSPVDNYKLTPKESGQENEV